MTGGKGHKSIRYIHKFISRRSDKISSGQQDENVPKSSFRPKNKQSRAGRYSNKQGKDTFNKQSDQFDRGKRKFQRRLKSSEQEPIEQTLRVNRKRTSRRTTKGYELAAFALADRAQEAARVVEEEF